MDFLVREAKTADAASIGRIHVDTWRVHYRGFVPDYYLESLSVDARIQAWRQILSDPRAGTETFVAEEIGNVMGFCNVGPSRDGDAAESTGELYSIYVSPREQKKGVGSALMRAGLHFLISKKFNSASLWVLKTNQATIRFYESKGWRADGQEKTEERNKFVFEEIRYVLPDLTVRS